jgi:hypothetical protein
LTNGPDGKPDGAVLAIGTLALLLLTGSVESQQERLRQLEELQVDPIALVSLSRVRLQELLEVLTTTAQAWDAAIQATEGA